MRKKDDMLRETLLELARETAEKEGAQAINIRDLAQRAGVATGTVYNYFADKSDIMLALTESYWQETLTEIRLNVTRGSFSEQMLSVFVILQKSVSGHGTMLMSSFGANSRSAAMVRMGYMQQVLCGEVTQRLLQDKKIKACIFDDSFTREKLSRLIVTNMVSHLRIGAEGFSFFMDTIGKILY